ncbi:unnamed protein product [Urochloa decumbens]|uniref:Uncharacterized protein n=1 Tax=Urochloa decumbens TaxID=240449 RepID=A0ABC9D3S3_9POAL
MPDVQLVPEGGPESPSEKRDEEARQFILQVKKIIERCVGQGMDKAEMFRVIREEGLPTWIAFAVFSELREQNHDFFKEYYSMHDLKKQREKLGCLIQAHRAGSGNAAAGARALETAAVAPAVAAMEPDSTAGMEWSDQQAAEHALLEGELARLLASSSTGGGDQFTGAAALPQKQAVVHCPNGQQPHDDQQAVYNEWLREMTALAEEAVPVPVPTLAGQQLHNNDLPVANGMFHGVAWPQQAAAQLPPAGQQLQLQHQQEQTGQLLAGQMLRYQQEQTGQLPAGQQLRYHQEQPVYFPADHQLQYQQEQAGQLPAGQQLHYQQQDLKAWLQLHYQERDLLTRQQLIQQQLLYYQQYQEHLMANNGGFHEASPALAAGLPSDTLMDPWPLSQDGVGWGQEQQDDLQPQGWPGAGADPSSTLPGDQQLGNQNFHSSNAGSIHEHPQ